MACDGEAGCLCSSSGPQLDADGAVAVAVVEVAARWTRRQEQQQQQVVQSLQQRV